MLDEQRIDLVDFMLIELNKKDLNNELYQRIKFYLETHKSRCNNYLYESSKYKESTIILTHMFKNIYADMLKDVSNGILK